MNLAEATYRRVLHQSLLNAGHNSFSIRHSAATLPSVERVVVVANGPSARHTVPPASSQVIAVDGALGRLLRAGCRPDLVVSADTHERIAHWFGAAPDEYFARIGEVGADANMKGLAVAIATASHPRTVEQCRNNLMVLYWWNAMLDDPSEPGLTRSLYEANGMPCLNGGGNVGTAAWVIAHSILKAKTVALVGFDFGYPPDFPKERTQYWPEMQEFGLSFITYDNGWYADPAMAWFREVFMQMARDAPCRTINCTEGGTLDGIERMPLAEFLG